MHWTVAQFAVAVLIACAGDSTSPEDAQVAGDWSLKSVNGAALPASRVDGGVTVTTMSAVLTMTGTSSGSYREVLTYQLTSGSSSVTQSQTALGTWAMSNGSITFHDQTYSATYQGSVSGGTITEVRTTATMVYSR